MLFKTSDSNKLCYNYSFFPISYLIFPKSSLPLMDVQIISMYQRFCYPDTNSDVLTNTSPKKSCIISKLLFLLHALLEVMLVVSCVCISGWLADSCTL